MRTNGSSPLTEKQKRRLFLEQLANSVEGPSPRRESMWWYLLVIAGIVAVMAYVVWTLNRSGPAAGVL